MDLEVTDDNISEFLLKNEITVIDFWAPWCGPCKMLGPIIEELSVDNEDIGVGKIDVDKNSASPKYYGIRGIPTLIFFKNGEEVDKIIGVASKAMIQDKIDGLKN
jgi:thioredoxin 1